jgi:hexulose-6-phosphate isomerase
MKKGINAWCFPAGYSLEEIFALASKERFEGLEINMTEKDGYLNLGMGEAGWKAIKDLSLAYDMPITSLSTGLFWYYPFTGNEPEQRARALDVSKEMVDAAAYFGCGAILVVPGRVDEDVSYKTAYKRAITGIKELGKYAEGKKVTVGVENVWNKFLLSPLEAAAFIDEIGNDYVKFYFDAGNVIQFSYPEHWVEALGGRIIRVHIKDYIRDYGNYTGFVPLLQGDMNWEKLTRALRDVGYDGYIIAELSSYKTNPAQSITDASAAMDYILSLK